MENKDSYIRFDWAVRHLLGDKANFGVLEGFIGVFLNEEIHILEILESENNPQAIDERFNRIDIKAQNSKGEIIMVEIQNTRELYYLERILYGVAKAVAEHIRLSRTYVEMRKVYSISILYFDIGKGKDYLYHGQTRFFGVHTEEPLEVNTKKQEAIISKMPEDVFPEYFLVRVNEFNRKPATALEEWVQYLKNGEIAPATKVPGLREVREKLRYSNLSPDEQRAYDEYIGSLMIQNEVVSTAKLEGREMGRNEGRATGRVEGRIEGRAEGLIEGREEGRTEEKIGIACTMKSDGIPIEVICKYTGLSVKEIEEL